MKAEDDNINFPAKAGLLWFFLILTLSIPYWTTDWIVVFGVWSVTLLACLFDSSIRVFLKYDRRFSITMSTVLVVGAMLPLLLQAIGTSDQISIFVLLLQIVSGFYFFIYVFFIGFNYDRYKLILSTAHNKQINQGQG